MKNSASDVSVAETPLRALYAPVEAELAEMDRILRAELESDYPYIEELVQYGCWLGGKRLRPALLLLCAKAVGDVKRDHLVLAAVVEMIHTATLIHDDVLDDAKIRRHLATVNSRWDTKTSVLLGDYLFTHAFYLASSVKSPAAMRILGETTNAVCEGELRQKGTRGDFSITEDVYLGIIGAKTAELYACSCRLGAYLADGSHDCADQLARFGRDVGIAFQIVDDVLDLQGDERTMGKSLGTDLEQQKATLPLIRVLQAATANDRRDVLDILRREANHRAAALAPFFQRYHAFAYSYELARRFARTAAGRLNGLAPSPACQSLRELAEFVVSRTR